MKRNASLDPLKPSRALLGPKNVTRMVCNRPVRSHPLIGVRVISIVLGVFDVTRTSPPDHPCGLLPRRHQISCAIAQELGVNRLTLIQWLLKKHLILAHTNHRIMTTPYDIRRSHQGAIIELFSHAPRPKRNRLTRMGAKL